VIPSDGSGIEGETAINLVPRYFHAGRGRVENMRLVHRQPPMLPIIVIAGGALPALDFGVQQRRLMTIRSCLDP
jgi:hypothetical protein